MSLHLPRSQTIAPSSALRNYELLHRITGEGLQVEYCFSRQPFSPDANMVAVQMQFTNNATSDAKNLHMEDVKLQSGMRVKEFPEIGESFILLMQTSREAHLYWRHFFGFVDRAASSRWDGHSSDGHRFLRLYTSSELPAVVRSGTSCKQNGFCDKLLNLGVTSFPSFPFFSTQTRKFFVSIQPPVGELMRPVFLTENEFKKEQGEWQIEIRHSQVTLKQTGKNCGRKWKQTECKALHSH